MTARRAWKIVLLFALANLLLVGWALTAHHAPGELRITFLDVGQGDAAVLESPSGKVLIVDTGGIDRDGGSDAGHRVLLPFLQSRGINRVDVLVLTHPHADHIGGAASLLDRLPVGMLLDNGQTTASPVQAHYLTAAKRRDVPCQAARQGQELDFGDGVTAHILAPNAEEVQLPEANNASVVVRVTYGREAFLLTGDAEADEEAMLLQSGQPLACDVLKVGHHGSHTSTTPAFLAIAHPHFAVISVGAHNIYGHPASEVVERLRDADVRVFRTDRNGAVTCHSNGITVRVETMLH